MERFDLIIIGGGPGGYEAAELAGQRGLKTALIEKNKLGGVCLNYGGIPLKGYLHLAHVQASVKELQKDRVITACGGHQVNQAYVIERNQRIIEKLQQGIALKLKNAGVTIYHGNAHLYSVNEGIIVTVNEQLVAADALIIATGSHAAKFPHAHSMPGYRVIYSDELFGLTSIPHQMVIVGAGAVGLEAASYFHTAGCEVVIVDIEDEIGSGLDRDIAWAYRKMLEHEGIRIYTDSSVKQFGRDEILIERKGEEISLQTEFVVIAVGRVPAIQGLGLEECGVDYDESGICIDSACRTNKRNIYACGDVTGKCMLAHAAYKQARVAVDNLTGNRSGMDYDIIPKIIYTRPEVMMVGLSEEECKARNIQCITKVLPLTYSGRYFIEHKNDGAKAKIIVDAETKTIIGFAMVGDGASEIALAAEIMIAKKMRIEDVADLVFPHPTVGEILRELTVSLITGKA